MSYKVEKLTENHILGEGPHWDERRQHLYYVDAFSQTIHRYIPTENRLTTAKIALGSPTCVSIVIPVKDTDDQFLITIDHQIAIVTWDGESAEPSNTKIVHESNEKEEVGKEKNRYNDGKVDPTGRLWVGTLHPEFVKNIGSLYSFDRRFAPTKRQGDVTVSNGMAWHSDSKTMYYIDTLKKTVDAYDFDASTGEISNQRIVFDFNTISTSFGGPDGMTIDTDGNLWIAVFGCGGVYQIDPVKKALLRKIDIPAPQTTSVAFGGPHLDELYVVSANISQSDDIVKKYPASGATFRVTGLGVRGLPMLPVTL